MSWTYAAQEREKAWRKAHPERVKEIKRKSMENAKLKAKEKRDTAPNVLPAGAVDEILAEVRRDAAIQEQIEETSGFTVGEVLLIRGVFWRIHALTEKRMYLNFLGGRGEVFGVNNER